MLEIEKYINLIVRKPHKYLVWKLCISTVYYRETPHACERDATATKTARTVEALNSGNFYYSTDVKRIFAYCQRLQICSSCLSVACEWPLLAGC